MKIKAAVEHITDMRKIGEYGIRGTPAFLINEKVLSVGIVPSKDEIKKWLRETTELGGKDLPDTETE
jgi:predicted DsbA family dithiol-disulfide isomerase